MGTCLNQKGIAELGNRWMPAPRTQTGGGQLGIVDASKTGVDSSEVRARSVHLEQTSMSAAYGGSRKSAELTAKPNSELENQMQAPTKALERRVQCRGTRGGWVVTPGAWPATRPKTTCGANAR
jgi:hypothetical protein